MGFNKLYEEYGDHPLFGRRVLHVMSPVRWKSTKWLHHGDSNWKVMEKTINWLPMCHHTALVPPNNTLENRWENVTLLPFDYAGSVLFNRGYFNSKKFLDTIDFSKTDVDFVITHQPELLYNVYNAMLTDRYGTTVDSFPFFHWCDSPKSRPTSGWPDGFFRQLESINLSYKSFVHCPETLKYLGTNWNKKPHTMTLDEETTQEKLVYMPLESDIKPDGAKEFPFTTDKKILLFNHRWNNTTGIKKLIKYTENLDRDKYLVWVTDEAAGDQKSGGMIKTPAPKWMRVQNLPSGANYKYLLQNCHATLCFVDDYMTWNLSVQDSLKMGKPAIVFDHPVQEYVLGKDYPHYFKTQEEFESVVENVPESIDWKLPPHDEVFKKNFVDTFVDAVQNSPKKKVVRVPRKAIQWLWHTMQDNGYKKNLLFNTHPKLYLSNTWEKIRLWVLSHGAVDDPTSEYTRFTIPEKNRGKVQQIIDNMPILEKTDEVFKDRGSMKNPNFTIKENKFW